MSYYLRVGLVSVSRHLAVIKKRPADDKCEHKGGVALKCSTRFMTKSSKDEKHLFPCWFH